MTSIRIGDLDRLEWTLPPMAPLLDQLRGQKAVAIYCAYTPDGEELVGQVNCLASNGRWWNLCPDQTRRVLAYVHRFGLARLRERLLQFGVAVAV